MSDMYAEFVTSEIKKWVRDPMMRFMLYYPLAFGLVGRFVLPWAAETGGFSMEQFGDVALVVLALMTPHVFGALTGFSILDDRDDHILTSIHVTPLSIHQFLSFRLVLVTAMCFAASVFVLWFSDIGGIAPADILAVALLVSLAAPMTGVLINALADNKVQGFAVMKGFGIVVIFPIAALFFPDVRELWFSFAPGFWPAKAISSLIRGEAAMYLSYSQYYLIGLAYVVALNVAMYRLFMRKVHL